MTRRTIAREIAAEGTALHAGTTVRMKLQPADPGTGIVFRRSDLGGREIPALYDRVGETRLGTVIDDGAGASVGVVEHLMAAVAGAAIDDLIVCVDGPEPPILDGDALGYLVLLEDAGFRDQAAPRRAVKVKKRVEVKNAEASAALEPASELSFDFEISFPTPAIGTQHMVWTFSPQAFRRDIAPARTFGFVHELDALLKMGRGRGASLQNTLALDGDGLRNPELQRFKDEFVRHKILDALGDLALAGAPIVGRFEGRKSGHAQNNALLRALFSDPSNYEEIAVS
ncbi:MAG: UDP-3-O-[3-hydroxymyristoyl] N-acetylglucosamine deacetylase [Proteobacteria bacterium]|nr:UDP-3-O-[3-hydroxymyristoyl] N-acetylglucosamine deacetylase [Pseudomonadota bacterium]